MGKLIFITGGARSGKSGFAVKLAKDYDGQVAFIATAEGGDEEMRQRIKKHRIDRPKDWQTIESPQEVAATLRQACAAYDLVIVDCLTLLVSNLLLAGETEAQITKQVEEIAVTGTAVNGQLVIVSNEVGSGLVPENELGRKFRDVAGKANQMVAQQADEVYLMVSGIALKVKGDSTHE